MGTKRPLPNEFISASEVSIVRPAADYEFRTLAELPGLADQYVNVIAKIVDSKPPTLTKVQEWSLVFTMADQTWPQGFRVTMFSKKLEDMPLVSQHDTSVGRVIRIIRMKVNKFGESVNGTAWPASPQNQRSSVLAFQEGSDRAFLVYPPNPRLTLTEMEEHRIHELIAWSHFAPRPLVRPALPAAAIPPSAHDAPPSLQRPAFRASSRLLLTLSQLTADVNYVDFIGKLVRTEVHRAGGLKLFLWDGTHNEQLEATSEEPPCSLLRVMVWNDLQGQPNFVTDRWLRLCNMQMQSKHGLEGHVRNRTETRVELLPDVDAAVQNRLSEWTARQQRHLLEQRRGPSHPVPAAIPPAVPHYSSTLLAKSEASRTRASHPHVSPSSLMRITTWPNPPYKFRCVNLRVLGYLPTDVRDITRPFCSACQAVADRVSRPEGGTKFRCNKCQTDLVNPSFVYMFSLIVADERTSIRMILYKGDAEYFFGLAAHDLYQNNVSMSVLSGMLQQLTAPTSRMDCCVKAYYRADSVPGPSGRRARRYRIFDTTMLHSGT